MVQNFTYHLLFNYCHCRSFFHFHLINCFLFFFVWSGIPSIDLLASDCLDQLDNVLGNSLTDGVPTNVSQEWDALFKSNDSNPLAGDLGVSASVANSDVFSASQLLDNFASSLKLDLSSNPGTVSLLFSLKLRLESFLPYHVSYIKIFV